VKLHDPDKDSMHFNLSTGDILWTLTFAAALVLLVVLLGRDRARRFPWFTTSVVLIALRMLVARLLFPRLPQLTAAEIFLPMADIAAIVSLLVVVEIARRAFVGAGRRMWIVATVLLLAAGGAVLALWGVWPSFKTLFAASLISTLRVMQLFAEKADLLANVLIILVGLLVVLFGRYFKAGWHSHTQQLAIGLSMASIAQLTIRGVVEHIAMNTTIRSQQDYSRLMGLRTSLNTANSILFLVVLLWWIACMWIDEPGTGAAESELPTANSE
jgi:hypothetical protein